MKGQTGLSVLIVLVVIFAVVGISVIATYNGIVKSEKIVEASGADIEAVCQRRLDLIPNLVETVKGYAKHESQTFIEVTKARSNAQSVLKQISESGLLSQSDISNLFTSQSELMGTLKNLFALVENYPDLKANYNFVALQDQLEGTENRIAVARQRYNYASRIYNTKIDTFPGNIIAPIFGFQEKIYFEAEAKSQETPKVSF